MIGIILLLGIVKKNSILLVDYTNQMRGSGEWTCDDALMKACPMRLRPILMTTVAMIAGASPGALAVGPGAELRQPMCDRRHRRVDRLHRADTGRRSVLLQRGGPGHRGGEAARARAPRRAEAALDSGESVGK